MNRVRYWFFQLQFVVLHLFFLPILMYMVAGLKSIGVDAIVGSIFLIVTLVSYLVLSVWTGWAVSVKRLHNLDMSAWWLPLFMIPILGWLLGLLVLGYGEGSPDVNRYGHNPLSSEGKSITTGDDK